MVRCFSKSITSIKYTFSRLNCNCNDYFFDRVSKNTDFYSVFRTSLLNYILPFDENDNAHILLKAVEIQIKSAFYFTCNVRMHLCSNFVPFYAIWEGMGFAFLAWIWITRELYFG